MLILTHFGAIAQLGERLHGMQEVVGSNPIGSINNSQLQDPVLPSKTLDTDFTDNYIFHETADTYTCGTSGTSGTSFTDYTDS